MKGVIIMHVRKFCLFVFFFCTASGILIAQVSSIRGSIVEIGTSHPIPNANIQAILQSDTTIGLKATTDTDGNFFFDKLPFGSYKLVVTAIGYKQNSGMTTIADGIASTIDLSLDFESYNLQSIIVTASRKKEMLLDAPASVAVIDERGIAERPAVSYIDHVEGTAGLRTIERGIGYKDIIINRGWGDL